MNDTISPNCPAVLVAEEARRIGERWIEAVRPGTPIERGRDRWGSYVRLIMHDSNRAEVFHPSRLRVKI